MFSILRFISDYLTIISSSVSKKDGSGTFILLILEVIILLELFPIPLLMLFKLVSIP